MSRMTKILLVALLVVNYLTIDAQTELIKDINPGAGWSVYEHLFDLDDQFYFLADSDDGREIWRSDGTTAGTQLLKDINEGPDDAMISELTAFNGEWYFSAFDSLSGVELWKTDGSTAGTQMLIDINLGTGNANPSHLKVVNNRLYFSAISSTNGAELWSTDGTATGTMMVADINAGGANASPQHLTDVNGTLYFTAKDGSTGRELWKSDGTAMGTVQVKDILTGAVGSLPADLTALGDKLFFVANDGVHGKELWFSDGTESGTVLVQDIYPGAIGSVPQKLITTSNTLFFTANDETHGLELWHTDGNLDNPSLIVEDLKQGPADSSPENFIIFDNQLFFYANIADNGFELGKSDGTEMGTALVKDINEGFGSSFPEMLVIKDNVLYFKAFSEQYGSELWKTDGTMSGTELVLDINPDTASANPTFAIIENDLIYFAAINSKKGWQVWQTDGQAANTFMVTDIPQDADFNPIYKPMFIQKNEDEIVFLGLDTLIGEELYKYTKVPINIEFASANNPLLCFGDNNAGISVSVSGGVGPDSLYTMEWTDANLTGMNLTDLSAGTYTFTVRDCGGQSETKSIEITEPPVLSFTTEQMMVSCFGLADGAASINTDGGTVPYNFEWSNGAMNPEIGGLTAGTFSFDISDSNGCTEAGAVTIEQPDSLILSTDVNNTTDITCNGFMDGQITLNHEGGNGDVFDYTWSDMVSVTDVASDLLPGVYTATITDSKGCQDSTSITLTEPDPVVAEVIATDSLECFGQLGSIGLNMVTGGNGEYTYTINNGDAQAIDMTSFVPAGPQIIVVTDGNACTYSDSVFIYEPDPIMIMIPQPTEPACFGLSTELSVSVISGGTAPFNLSVDSGEFQDINDTIDIFAGTHTIEVVDVEGCIASSEITIDQPDELMLQMTATDDIGNSNSGTATASVMGGTMPYSFQWNTDPVQDSMTAINLPAGVYTVNISDINDCMIVDSVEVLFVSDVNELSLFNHLIVSPNPSKEVFNIDLELKEPADIEIKISNITSKVLRSYKEENINNLRLPINLSTLPTGMYLMSIQLENELITRKLILQH